MKKRLVCLALSLLMIIPMMLTGCGLTQTTDETADATTTETGTRATMTLTLWVPAGGNVTDEAVSAVEERINSITKAKYKTMISLRVIPSDDYEAAVDERITYIEEAIIAEEAAEKAAREEAKKLKAQGITTEAVETTSEDESSVTEEETIVNDLGMTELKYPGIADQQMDIFLVRGYDNYTAYCEREALSMLDDELNGTSKILKSYIYPSFLTACKYNGSTYALPNNHVIGEYKFLLINKRMVEEYYYDIDTMTNLIKCEPFILDMAKTESSVPALLDTVDPIGMKYWSEDGSFSVIASQIANTASNSTKAAPKSVFAIKAFTDNIGMMKRLEAAGAIAHKSVDDVDEFAVGVINGGAEIYDKYGDDYYISVYQAPMAKDEDIFGSMFAISAYTKNLARSMEILTYLNTNTELRTALQYGVEGLNYEYDDSTETISQLNSDYTMNINETGNVYMTYPDYGVSMDTWDYAKTQNQASIVTPYLMFSEDLYLNTTTKAQFDELKVYSDDIKARIDAAPADTWADFVTATKDEIAASTIFTKMTDIETEGTLGFIYDDWYATTYPAA